MSKDHKNTDHDDHESRGHSHGLTADADVRYVLVALGLIGAFMIGEGGTAILSGSLVVR